MKPQAIGYTVAGMFFGILLGWVMATQHAGSAPAPAAQPAATQAAAERQPPPLDESRVQALRSAIASNAQNAAATTELANLYFDAERYDDAIEWYERALKLDPKNPNLSTDLGVSYYYTNRPDHALTQFEYSLKLDPAHVKTLFNKGIVLAFGKEDFKGAAQAWQRVVELSPDSREGQAARRALEGIASAHPGGAVAPANQ